MKKNAKRNNKKTMKRNMKKDNKNNEVITPNYRKTEISAVKPRSSVDSIKPEMRKRKTYLERELRRIERKKESQDQKFISEQSYLLLGYADEADMEDIKSFSLRVSSSNGRTQYYLRTNPADRKGTYIPKSKVNLAEYLTRNNYYMMICRAIEKEIKAISKYLVSMPETVAEQIYAGMHPARQALVDSWFMTDEEYADIWSRKSYAGKVFDEDLPEYITEKGERVRSKSEILIANMLFSEDIPYRYECPLYLEEFGTVYPDFTILDAAEHKELYWEHFGMMDNPEYAEKAVKKISTYIKNGYLPGRTLITTFETRNCPMDISGTRKMIRGILGKDEVR